MKSALSYTSWQWNQTQQPQKMHSWNCIRVAPPVHSENRYAKKKAWLIYMKNRQWQTRIPTTIIQTMLSLQIQQMWQMYWEKASWDCLVASPMRFGTRCTHAVNGRYRIWHLVYRRTIISLYTPSPRPRMPLLNPASGSIWLWRKSGNMLWDLTWVNVSWSCHMSGIGRAKMRNELRKSGRSGIRIRFFVPPMSVTVSKCECFIWDLLKIPVNSHLRGISRGFDAYSCCLRHIHDYHTALPSRCFHLGYIEPVYLRLVVDSCWFVSGLSYWREYEEAAPKYGLLSMYEKTRQFQFVSCTMRFNVQNL